MVPDAQDVVCLIKHFMHSDHLSQEPLLVLPTSVAQKVTDAAPTLVLMRNPFSEREAREYGKTAEAVSKPPWDLHVHLRNCGHFNRTEVCPRSTPSPKKRRSGKQS